MRVGLYVHGYTPVSGGGYTFQREILKAISSLAITRHHFAVLAYNKGDWPASIEFMPIEQTAFKHVNLFDRFWHKLSRTHAPANLSLSPLDFTAKKNHVDLIWFVTPAYEPTNIPYLATVWDLQHRLQPWFPEVGNLREWEGRETYFGPLFKRATCIITPNKAGLKELSLFYQVPEDRILCLPHPTPELTPITTREEQSTLEKYHLQPGFLFYPAQYWAHKNHANLLFALKILKETYNLALPVVFVGADKGNLDYLKKLTTDLNMQSYVHFLGFVSNSELTALYQTALALVYPSYFGPENLPPLEAFSVGCPVIAANVSGADEQLGNAALLVDPSSADEIAAAISSLAESSQLRESLIIRGRDKAKQTTALDYVKQVVRAIDTFEPTRRAWES
jgi:glycosyltransferase involved in cell wall biosynthesis